MKKIYTLLFCIIACYTINAQDKIVSKDSLFTINKTDLSTEGTEFGAVLVNKNQVIFTKTNVNLTEEDKHKADLDIFSATLNKDNSFTEVTALKNINTKWHDGTATISADGNTMYFGSESFNTKKGFEKEKTTAKIYKRGKIYLFKAIKMDGEWINPTPLPFNKVNYSVRNPSLSKDGKTLYFSSNMPGGLGGEDIWKVTINGDSYGTPENLGNNVNSDANESFPFIAENGDLYFSSDKDGGLGGLDVYKLNNNKVSRLGKPVNSEKDDFAFFLDQKEKIGFLSSNRDETDDIYLIAPICKLFANITVIDKETKQAVLGANLTLLDNEKVLDSVITNNLVYTKKLECDKPYFLKATKEGYEDATQTIKESTNGGDLQVVVEMTPIVTPIITEKEVILDEIYFVFDKSYITEQGKTELDKLVAVMNEYPEMKILVKSHTDNIGDDAYNIGLSDRRAKSTVAYIVSKGIAQDRISGKGYGETEPKVNCERCTIEQNQMNRRSEFIIVK